MMSDMIYVISWEIIKSGKVREQVFLDKEEFEEFFQTIIGSKDYKLLEAYKLDLEDQIL